MRVVRFTIGYVAIIAFMALIPFAFGGSFTMAVVCAACLGTFAWAFGEGFNS